MRVTYSLGLIASVLFLASCGQKSEPTYQVKFTSDFSALSAVTGEEQTAPKPPKTEDIKIEKETLDKVTAAITPNLQAYHDAVVAIQEEQLLGKGDEESKKKLEALTKTLYTEALNVVKGLVPVLSAAGIKDGEKIGVALGAEGLAVYAPMPEKETDLPKVVIAIKLKLDKGGKVAGFELKAVKVEKAN